MEPSSVYLIKDFDNQTIFPRNSGRFNPSQIDSAYSYEVHGDLVDVTTSTLPKDANLPTTPYGAYTIPKHTGKSSLRADMSQPLRYPNCNSRGRVKNTMISKTIVLVTLHGGSHFADRPSSSKMNLLYEVVTQTQFSVDPNDCSPSAVAHSVSQSVGFEVILLDSKCYPLLDNATTSTSEFWRSTRKILAASKSVFQRLSGTSIDFKKRMNDETTHGDVHKEVPTPKRPCFSGSVTEKKLDKIESRFTFIDTITKFFECVVCKSICKKPCATSTCCQRILGCTTCVQRWIDQYRTCPHCSANISMMDIHDIKGMDELLNAASVLSGEVEMQVTGQDGSDEQPTALPSHEADQEAQEFIISSEEDDFELPRASFRQRAS